MASDLGPLRPVCADCGGSVTLNLDVVRGVIETAYMTCDGCGRLSA